MRMPVKFVRRLVSSKLPPIIAHMLYSVRFVGFGGLDFVELFCGAQALCKGMRYFNWRAVGLDLQHSADSQNIMNPAGLFNAMCHTWRLAPYTGQQGFGTKCSNFVWMCRASTSRSAEVPEGNQNNVKCNYFNEMVVRTVILVVLGAIRHVKNTLEQPQSNTQERLPRLRYSILPD